MVRHLLSLGAALGLLASATMAKEMPVNEEMAAIWYDSGLAHEESMHHKSELWRMEREMGLMDSENYPELGYHACTNGWIEAIPGDRMHTFRCDQMDLHHFLSHGALNSTGQGSGTWGWISDDGREFAAIGQEDGAAFVEIKDGKLVLVARLPQPPTALVSNWREMKSYKNYMVIGSEAVAHGIQIFDMTKLLDIDVEATGPVVFDPIADLSGYTNDLPIGRSHNVVVNEERDYMVAVGSQPRNDSCRAGLIFFDITDVANPVRQGCAADDGYVHDAHCLVYRGPDKRYDGKDICYGYNEDSLTIYDVSDKTTTNIISRTSYEGVNYTHQGWVTDVNNQEFLLMNDERDERYRAGPASDGFPVVYVWDIRDLEKPKQTGTYKYPTRAIDHNLYIKDGIMFQSNYGNGYQLMDVSSVGPSDTTGSGICRAAFIDIYPEDDNVAGGGIIEFVARGLRGCPPAPTCNADNCLRAMRAESVQGRLEESQEFCAAYTANLVTEVSVLPEYATKACTGDAISRVSSACACIPTVAPAN
ncbi:hypothetical protein MCOR34_006640 [Pyricularia oryzae]|nr:hypothetical protein MCOR34_006640 [Pyricularia oryzae]KAI6598344.1 hypothetical protein MCOR04_002637 [Pyricularia oryzae]